MGNIFLTVNRKWSRHWRFPRSEAFRVRVWNTLCGQCWDILLGLREIGLAIRDKPGSVYSPWKWAIFDHRSRHSPILSSFKSREKWSFFLDKDALSCLTCRGKIERALWVIWIQLGFSREFCGVALSYIIYTRGIGASDARSNFLTFPKQKDRSNLLIWFSHSFSI